MRKWLAKWLDWLDRQDLINHTRKLWTIAILLAVLLNIFLFLGITFLTGSPTDKAREEMRFGNVIRLMTGRPADRDEEKEALKKESLFETQKEKKIMAEKETVSVSPIPTKIEVSSTKTESMPESSFGSSGQGNGSGDGGGRGSGHGTYGESDLDGPLVPISRRLPVYPADARRREIEGSVRVKFLVNEKGRVENIDIVWSKPPGVFEKSVLSCVGEWFFQPGRVGGKTVSVWAYTTLRFKLDE